MKNTLLLTGILGLFASIFVGTGEYLLHYDPLARFAQGGFVFMEGISEHRTTIGHFFGVFGATLYPIGCYHIYLMLRSANQPIAKLAFFVSAFGFIVGAVWIGSRAHISSLMQLPSSDEITHLVELYELRYEVLLTVVRIAVLVLSVVFIWLTLTGRSNYPKWMAVFNPFVLILVSFGVYAVAPEIGKHLMPIALNVAFFIFFSLSLKSVKSLSQQGQ